MLVPAQFESTPAGLSVCLWRHEDLYSQLAGLLARQRQAGRQAGLGAGRQAGMNCEATQTDSHITHLQPRRPNPRRNRPTWAATSSTPRSRGCTCTCWCRRRAPAGGNTAARRPPSRSRRCGGGRRAAGCASGRPPPRTPPPCGSAGRRT